MNSIDLGRAVKAPFESDDWLPITGLAWVWGILAILFFPLFAVYNGAQLEYIRRVSRGNERLPDWSEFGTKWSQGLLVWVAGFVYFLPVIVLGTFLLLPVITAAINGNQDAVIAAAFGSGCVFFIAAVVFSVVLWVFYAAAIVHFAMVGSFGALFDFGGIMRHMRDGSGYFTAWLYTIVISFAASTVTSIISTLTSGFGGILGLPITFLSAMMMAHVLGQWAARSYGVTAAAAYPAPGGYPPSAGPVYQPPAPPSPPAPPAAPGHQAPAPPAPPAQPPVAPPPPSGSTPQ